MQVFSTRFFWFFVGFYLLQFVVYLGLEILNYRHVKKQADYPVCYRDFIAPAGFNKSRVYTLEKIRFGITAHLGQIPFFWFLIFRNGFNTFDYYAALAGGFGTLTHSVLFCIYIAIYFGIINLPFKIYSLFVIEEKYGFNRTTPMLFITDLAKSLFMATLLGVPLLYAVFWFMQKTGSWWWFWVWALMMLVQIIMTAVYPYFLAPLFNKFTPLADGELKQHIVALADKINFKMSGVFVADGSRRSGHSNAYFAGMGRFRRIVLFDTLVGQLSTQELIAVLAHEMGHNVKKHILRMMLISGLIGLVALYALACLVTLPDFFTAFNLSTPSTHGALVIFMLCSDVVLFLLTPLMNGFSRKHEYQADRFSSDVVGNGQNLSQALIKLARDNLANLTPHPLYSFFHYSHPTVDERIRALT